MGEQQTRILRLRPAIGKLKAVLQAEMDEHLGYEKHDISGNNSGNSRNGYNRKTISSHHGESEIEIPRDRNGSFEPKIIGKYQTKGKDIENQIITMYAKGMSNTDIATTMQDIYGITASKDMVTAVTDKVLPLVMEWYSKYARMGRFKIAVFIRFWG